MDYARPLSFLEDPDLYFRALPRDIRVYYLRPMLEYEQCPQLCGEAWQTPTLVHQLDLDWSLVEHLFEQMFVLRNGDLLLISLKSTGISRYRMPSFERAFFTNRSNICWIGYNYSEDMLVIRSKNNHVSYYQNVSTLLTRAAFQQARQELTSRKEIPLDASLFPAPHWSSSKDVITFPYFRQIYQIPPDQAQDLISLGYHGRYLIILSGDNFEQRLSFYQCLRG